VAASTILLVDTDSPSRDVIVKALTDVGYSITTVADEAQAFAEAGDHDLVILDILSGPKSAADVCREIRATPAMVAIPVLCISQTDDVDERIRFLQAGADDVMAKPYDALELQARVEALLLRFRRSRDLAPALAPKEIVVRRPHMVAVFSPKGGVGATTIAVNTAVSAAQRHTASVLLIDMDLQFGQVATHLNMTPDRTLAEVAKDETAQREPELLRTYALPHELGIHVLAAPGSPELAELVTAKSVELILRAAVAAYDYVVVDAGSSLDERTLIVLDHADTVIFPVYPEIAALKALHSLVDYLNEAGSVAAKSIFVLNNLFSREMLKMPAIESALGTTVAAVLPYDPFLYLKAVNEGVPIVKGAPASIAAERLTKLSADAFGEDGVAPVARPAERKPRRLGGLLRRT